MSRVSIIILFFLFAQALPVIALEDTPENRAREANRYTAAVQPKEMMNNMAIQMAKVMPPEMQQRFVDTITKHLDITQIEHIMNDSMVKTFTADELKALADFYSSEFGKSAMNKMGAFMADAMPKIQPEMIRAKEKAIQELTKSQE